MFSYTKQSGKTTYGLVELVIDKLADLTTLPTDAAPGSTCFVLENSSAYMLNNEHVWEEIK